VLVLGNKEQSDAAQLRLHIGEYTSTPIAMIEASKANLFFAVRTIPILRVDLLSRKQA
jgi:hypothetical protein